MFLKQENNYFFCLLSLTFSLTHGALIRKGFSKGKLDFTNFNKVALERVMFMGHKKVKLNGEKMKSVGIVIELFREAATIHRASLM